MSLAKEFMSRAEVLESVGIAPSTLAYLVKCGRFPQPLTVTKKTRLWERAQVAQWLADRIAERDARAADKAAGRTE